MATELNGPFAELLPRLSELKDMTDQSHPDAYFHDFESRFAEGRTVLGHYQRLERRLAGLDDGAWSDLRGRAAVVAHIRENGRGWEALFDVLNEATGYDYLKHIGCMDIRFITRRKTRTPDLMATRDGRRVLCEVKTINVSDDEAARRRRISQDGFAASNTLPYVENGLLTKMTATLAHAVAQLDGEDPERKAQRIVFTVLSFDDWVGDCQTEYFAQLDAHLLQNPIVGAELVFSPWSNLFERRFTMRSAAVFQD